MIHGNILTATHVAAALVVWILIVVNVLLITKLRNALANFDLIVYLINRIHADYRSDPNPRVKSICKDIFQVVDNFKIEE